MKAARFDYSRPSSLAEALKGLLAGENAAKPMSGSQSLGPMLNLRLARPPAVVDVSGLTELRGVERRGDRLRVGAAVTHAEIEDGVHELLRGHPMQGVAGRIAYRAVRNRGTLGGSLAHADPAADWVVVCAGLGARLEIAGPRGAVRHEPAQRFMAGAYTTSLQEGELIVAVDVPAGSADSRFGYYKFCRKTGEFAEASCVAWFDPASRSARIVLGAIDATPRALTALAQACAREGAAAVTAAAIRAAVEAALPEKDAVERRLYETAVARCLAQALGTSATLMERMPPRAADEAMQ
ncbi:FAD binding domain-containing protein [Bordetella pseudohinzii]|uniref:Carbon monoxide dehydrogenase n=1 Tax=Bordetella pseudohinzii TaxID=1331258 RepID=A0A0J6C8T1_9BORD|nr:FAD binding domain-containing protein [Bordetella pseudohinzii]ANY17564.1 carbon monoxide dehydrogenase [Bordetella pseudohinzii]KMM25792.1 carbon monoxide dehydrogenase [Bordetella pseudohinzii]KXA81780.1 carbon monoxide dehydrogenase [Bordetella pseudohinzii]KXA82980.1 carbon monoxide dehydrogenase [Bordetella pseudohinzii]CUI74030.1 Carbon monoxide dehydrogenase medium chain [Bordetella pseudohinzii]